MPPRKLRLGIQPKILILLCLMGLIPAVLAWLVFYFDSSLPRQIGQSLENQAAALASRIDDAIQSAAGQARLAALSPVLREAAESSNASFLPTAGSRRALENFDHFWMYSSVLTPEMRPYLENPAALYLRTLQEENPEVFPEIFITDGFGRLAASTGRTSDFYQADEDWWRQAWNEGHGGLFLGPAEYDKSAGVYSMDVAVPVPGGGDKAVGVLKMVLRVERVFALVSGFKLGETGEAALVSSDGRVIVSSRRAAMETSLPKERLALLMLEAPSWGFEKLEDGKSLFASAPVALTYAPGGGRNFFGRKWNVVLTQEAAESLAPLRRVMWRGTAAAGILILAIGSAGWFLARFLVKPIRVLHVGVRKIERGDLEHRVHVESGDEIEALADAFNQMAGKLECSHTELEEINQHLEEKIEERTRALEAASVELYQVNADLLRASQMKTQFLAAMSHELRTPLNSIIGFSELLRDGVAGELGEKPRRYAENILKAGQHLLNLINDVLDIAKIEAGRIDVRTETFDLPALVDEVTESVRGLAFRKHIALHVRMDASLGRFRADAKKVKQILYNLLSNAVKYTPEGGSVWVEAERVRAEATVEGMKESECLRVQVKDTGIGIAEEDCNKVFREFERIDSAYSREQEGTGLGLALCRKLAEMQGGTIGFESQVALGSTFYLLLPFRADEDGDSASASVEPQGAPEAPLVLIVEDDSASVEVLTDVLRHAGYRSVSAGRAEEALRLAAELRPRAITLDIRLPGQDGWSVLHRLKENPATRGIPVVVVTVTDNRRLGLSLGAARYLTKPVRREELIACLNELVYHEASRNVVAIDDDEGTLRWYRETLEGASCRVRTAENGKKGLEMVMEEIPDLVFLDLKMDGMDGFGVLDELRRRAETATVPVVVVTGKELSGEEFRRLDGKIQHLMRKGSCSREDLLRDLHEAMRARAPEEPS
jgi:signal transduction histidine kinase/CheY-like chemotaxis protein